MDKVGLGQVKNLIMLALADGKATDDELALIASIASREGMSEEELHRLLEHPESVHIELPTDEAVRQKYLEDMVLLMIVDGNMDDIELALCKIYAIRLGFDPDSVEQLVVDIATRLEASMA